MRRLLVALLAASLVFSQANARAGRRAPIVVPAPSGPGIAWVQDDLNVTPCDSTGDTNIAKAFTSNVTAGNAITVAFAGGADACHYSGLSKAIVTDTLGNTYQAGADLYDAYGHNACAGVQYALNSPGGANTVTVTWYDNSACSAPATPNACCTGLGTGTCTIVTVGYRGIFITEYSGVKTTAALTASAGATGTTAAWSSGAISATTGDLVFTLALKASGAAVSSTPGASFTERATMDQVTACGMVAEEYYPAVAGSIAGTGTFDVASDWVSLVVALKAQ